MISGRIVDLVGSPFKVHASGQKKEIPAPATMPPGLGQDTEEVLRDWLGVSGEDVAELRKRGVVG